MSGNAGPTWRYRHYTVHPLAVPENYLKLAHPVFQGSPDDPTANKGRLPTERPDQPTHLGELRLVQHIEGGEVRPTRQQPLEPAVHLGQARELAPAIAGPWIGR